MSKTKEPKQRCRAELQLFRQFWKPSRVAHGSAFGSSLLLATGFENAHLESYSKCVSYSHAHAPRLLHVATHPLH